MTGSTNQIAMDVTEARKGLQRSAHAGRHQLGTAQTALKN